MAQKKLTIIEYIDKHKVNKSYLAKRIGMPESTFKNKWLATLPQYKFNAAQEAAIVEVLKEMSVDAQNIKLTALK